METNDVGTETLLHENAQLRRRLTDLEADLRRIPRFGLVFERQPGDEPEVAGAALAERLPVLTELTSRRVPAVVPSDGPPHLLIEGDNLHALTAMQYTHAGAVDVIYIDPPYNTGNEFVYNDKLVDKVDAWRHSKWLSFMDRRLRLAHNLLAERGIIFVAIDDHEQAHLRLLCDQIFDEGNFIAQLVWNGGRKNDSRFVSTGHDYCLVYARNKTALLDAGIRWRELKEGQPDILAAGGRFWEQSGQDAAAATELLKAWFKALAKDSPAKKHKHYNHIDENGRVFFPADISWPNGQGPKYEVLHPTTGKPCRVPRSGWRFPTPERMQEMVAAGKIHFGPDETRIPNRKTYLDEVDSEVPEAVFYKDRRASNGELAAMVGKGKFQFPKDPTILARWLRLAGPDDAVVLDFFAGSGSTAHAVALLNASDGGTRQAILATNNENNICTDVTHPRLKAALTGDWADGPREPLPGELRYYRCKFVTRSTNRDTLLTRLAAHAVDLVAIRERTFDLSAGEKGRWALLTGRDKAVAVWADPDLCDISPLTDAAAGVEAADKVLYCFTSDDDKPAIDLDEWPGWRTEALPRHLLHAMRAAADA